MVELGLLLLCRVMHALDLAGLLASQQALLLMVRNLLVLLRHVARLAAARAKAISAGVAIEVVLGADVASVDHREDERDTETA